MHLRTHELEVRLAMVLYTVVASMRSVQAGDIA